MLDVMTQFSYGLRHIVMAYIVMATHIAERPLDAADLVRLSHLDLDRLCVGMRIVYTCLCVHL